MFRRDLLLALCAFALAGNAGAAEPKAAAGQYVDLSPVAMPVVVNGRLVNYVFVSMRVNLAPTANAPKLREREPYFRDALVRAGHRTPFTDPTNYDRLDDRRLKAAMFTAAQGIAGAGMVASIEILPGGETPKQRTGLPRPKAAAAR